VKALAVAMSSGALFGVGLAVSGMTRPEKVIGFLDLAGAWDASLAFVMGGAIAVHFIAHLVARRRMAPLFDARFHLPTRKDVDRRLVAGAAIFGVGWGLGGFCPGPAIVAASSGALPAVVFVAAMTVGILVEDLILSRRAMGAAPPDAQV
jgi:uncharacterized membrane protein YedE/YeeE